MCVCVFQGVRVGGGIAAVLGRCHPCMSSSPSSLLLFLHHPLVCAFMFFFLYYTYARCCISLSLCHAAAPFFSLLRLPLLPACCSTDVPCSDCVVVGAADDVLPVGRHGHRVDFVLYALGGEKR